MSTPEPPLWARLVMRRLAEGRLPARILRRAHRRTHTDPSWRAWYHALRTAERAAAGMPDLSVDQRATLRALVLADLDGAAPEHQPGVGATSLVRRMGAPLVFAAAAAAIFFVVRGPSFDEEFAARSDGAPVIGMRARCVDESSRAIVAEAEAGTGLALRGGRMRCPSGGLVALSVTNATTRSLVVVVTVIDESGEPQVISLEDGFDVPAKTIERSLPVGVRLGRATEGTKAHRAVFASFFEKRPRHGQLQSALRAAHTEGVDLRSASRLPLGARADVRIDVDVGP